ncbi:glycine cleavage system aminomethyltransferase GcvT [Candidatus Dependentiae bacterium]|nr:glycine cleavage system aminomethyltransferase GcvT [Candidatus Dependentiae bacterium]
MKHILLEEKHKSLGAKFIEFGGWNMPVHYGSIIDEHNSVRNNAGVFDVSHMGKLFISGKDSQKFLSDVLPADINGIKEGKGVYTQLLNNNAGIIDDLIVYKISSDNYFIIVNAANIEKDFKTFSSIIKNYDCSINNLSENFCIFAVQGKNAWQVVDKVLNISSSDIRRFNFIEIQYKGSRCFICRTGYTGEDGFEIVPHNNAAPEIFSRITEEIKNICGKMCGLGCRDTLRLEAGYMLHGHDIDETTTPVEAGLEWSIKGKGYIAESVIQSQIKNGVQKKIAGFVVKDKGIIRSNCSIISEGKIIGNITSGSFSPTLNKSIGIGYIHPDYFSNGKSIYADVRGKFLLIERVKLPFLKKI